MIKECPNCKPHPYQDQKYNGKRVMTVGKSAYKCTVCGKEQIRPASDKK